MICLFLFVYFILFVMESIKLSGNPRPKMYDSCNFRFRDVNKIKTHNFGVIESR